MVRIGWVIDAMANMIVAKDVLQSCLYLQEAVELTSQIYLTGIAVDF